MKKIFKEAHKLTKEITSKYEVDYKIQFGLCLSYLLEETKEEKVMKKIEGTEKQIEYANNIIKEMNIVTELFTELTDKAKLELEERLPNMQEENKVKFEPLLSGFDKFKLVIEDANKAFNSMNEANEIINIGKVLLDKTSYYTGGANTHRLKDTEANFKKFMQSMIKENKIEKYDTDRLITITWRFINR